MDLYQDLKLYHKLLGEHSNIPECCIDAFVNLQNRTNKYDKLFHEVEKQIGVIPYRPCFDCLTKKNIVNTHECDADCIDFFEVLSRLTGHYPATKAYWVLKGSNQKGEEK